MTMSVVTKETGIEPDEVVAMGESFDIGSKPNCDYCIKDDQVTDMHAVIERSNGQSFIRDRGSQTGTLVNNRPITEIQLSKGDWISIGSFMFQFLGDHLAVYRRGHQFRILGVGLKRIVSIVPEGSREPKSVTLIDNVSLVIEPGEFTAIIGPSGSGKSTLLNALSARVPADVGEVSVNGQNLVENFESLKRSIVLVPQRETIHDTLSVRRILTHTARLRMPIGTSRLALSREVTRVLSVVGLMLEHHETPFRLLSGGQKKRVCLANELIGNPGVIFLDEVTSGLDEEADGRMMELFRKLADAGKTVIGITHNLANVERYCHRVVVMAYGGRFVFAGTPSETIEYFNVPRLGEVYKVLEEGEPPRNGMAETGFVGNARSVNAEGWRRAYDSNPQRVANLAAINTPSRKASSSAIDVRATSVDEPIWRRVIGQALVLSRRYVDLLLADRNNLAAMTGTSLLVALLLIIVFGNVGIAESASKTGMGSFVAKVVDNTTLLFLLEFSCMWFGCTNAAKEIVKEADIYRMERHYSLHPVAYYLSKVVVLSIMSLIQASILYFPVKIICQIPGDIFYQFFTLGSLTIVGVTIGLVISCVAITVDVSTTLVPIVMIPQFILASVIKELTGVSKLLANGAAIYWGHKGTIASLPQFIRDYIKDTSGWTLSHFMLLVHTTVYVAMAIWLLRTKDKGLTTMDLIRMAQNTVSDQNGAAARTLQAAKNRIEALTRARK
jgi:ABC-type multidrug transport system ATPase subunit